MWKRNDWEENENGGPSRDGIEKERGDLGLDALLIRLGGTGSESESAGTFSGMGSCGAGCLTCRFLGSPNLSFTGLETALCCFEVRFWTIWMRRTKFG